MIPVEYVPSRDARSREENGKEGETLTLEGGQTREEREGKGEKEEEIKEEEGGEGVGGGEREGHTTGQALMLESFKGDDVGTDQG